MDHQHSQHPRGPAGDGPPDGPDDHLGDDGDRGGDGDGDDEGDHGRGWAGWLLVVAAALPVLVLAEATRQVFTGARDDWMNGYPRDGSQLTPDISLPFWSRFDFWLFQVPPAPALLASTLGVVVVTGVVLLARPLWLVPARPARWAAAAVAALVALGSLATAAGVLAMVSRTSDDVGVTFYGTGTGLVELGPDVASLALTAVVAALCGLVLLRPPAGVGSPVAVASSSASPEVERDEPSAAASREAEREEPGVAPAPGHPAAVAPPGEPGRGPAEPAATPEVPRFPSGDPALYRRPVS